MIKTKSRINCGNCGQLFRATWLSSARCSETFGRTTERMFRQMHVAATSDRPTIKITRVVNLPLEIWNAGCGKLHTWSSKEIVTWLKKIITWLVCLHVILSMLKARSLSWNPHSNYLDEKILSPEIRKISCIFWFLKVEVSWFSQRVNYNFSKALKLSFSRVCISIIECQQFRRNLLKESHSMNWGKYF